MNKQHNNGVSLRGEASLNVHRKVFHCQENTSIAERFSHVRRTKFTGSTTYNQ